MDLQFFATAPKNLESLLAAELRELGMAAARETRGGAAFTANLEGGLRACLWSRVASRVLLLVKEFPAASPEELYHGVREIDWSEHFGLDETFAVACSCSASTISHSHYAALKAKDAIVDQFRDRSGSRPSVDPDTPDIRVNIHILRDRAAVSIDLSGDSLHRRGWRKEPVAAPLKENLAAAVLMRAGWREIAASGGSFVDPMCGSGSLVIEAAMIAADIAPGLLRQRWGFTAWRGHDPAVWQKLLKEAGERRKAGLARLPVICGSDRDPAAAGAAKINVAAAGLAECIRISRGDIAALSPPKDCVPGLVAVNPPYGERLEDEAAAREIYRVLGERLRKKFRGWRAAVLTGRPELGRAIGLVAVKVHALMNGAIPCRLLHFEITPQTFAERGPRPLRAEADPGAEMFANRLKKNLKKLRKWREREQVTCFRAYDADLPEYNLALDVYEDAEKTTWLVIQEYEAPATVDARKARARLRGAVAAAAGVFGVGEEKIFVKVRRRQKGKNQYEKLASRGEFHEVNESGCRFLVNFSDYLDTGIFLDHRPTRKLIATLAAGRDFLNLFAYTGTATVCAAKGGARSTTSVDLSNTYLAWARRNMELNGFGGMGGKHVFTRADCTGWLAAAAKKKKRYGLIFLDPPSFSASKKMGKGKNLDIQRDHAALIRAAARLLAPDGILIFSTNLRGFRLAANELEGLRLKDLSRATLPPDFSRNPRIHQCWEIRLVDGSWFMAE